MHLRALSIASVTERNTRVKDLSHRQIVILTRRLSAGEKNIAPLDPGNHPGKEKN